MKPLIRPRNATDDHPLTKIVLCTIAIVFIVLFLVMPLATVFTEALAQGWQAARDAVIAPDALDAIKLTLIVAAIVVPLNMIFGLTASWCIAKFDFRGKNLLITLLDIPFSVSLGASGWSTFWRVTLPNVKWALLYGVLLCTARAMGEFGAVSVVSGHIRGMTDTMPLHVEVLYNDYQYVGAFAVASLLAMLALVTLGFKSLLEWRFAGEIAATHKH